MSRQIFLDTETTGLEAEKGHRVIEVVALAYQHRRPVDGGFFHSFCNPCRDIEPDAQKVHGISAEFLQDKPMFGEIAGKLQEFLRGGEIFIHNAEFDRRFLDSEFARCDLPPLDDIAGRVVCTLEMSRRKNSGLHRHRLEDLCRHFGVDDSARTTHNAMLDAKLLAQVYYAMTREQVAMNMAESATAHRGAKVAPILIGAASKQERAAHEKILDGMEKESGATSVWRR